MADDAHRPAILFGVAPQAILIGADGPVTRNDGNVGVRQLRPSGLAWAWWRGDPLPPLEPLPGLTVAVAPADDALAELNRVSLAEVRRREEGGNRPYVAYAEGEPVAYGWVATRDAEFGNRLCEFEVPASARYLWDFATVPAWRGHGIYPRLLQAILDAESGDADRFWILHAWTNEASKRGIARAGFQAAATIYWLHDGSMSVAPFEASDRAEACAALLGLPLVSTADTLREDSAF